MAENLHLQNFGHILFAICHSITLSFFKKSISYVLPSPSLNPDMKGNTQGLVWEPIPPPLAVHWLGTRGGPRNFEIRG